MTLPFHFLYSPTSFSSPYLQPIFFPSIQSSTPTIRLYDKFCDNPVILWEWVLWTHTSTYRCSCTVFSSSFICANCAYLYSSNYHTTLWSLEDPELSLGCEPLTTVFVLLILVSPEPTLFLKYFCWILENSARSWDSRICLCLWRWRDMEFHETEKVHVVKNESLTLKNTEFM